MEYVKKVSPAIQEKNNTREILMNFIKSLENLIGEQTEFREELWGGLVDYVRADSDKKSNGSIPWRNRNYIYRRNPNQRAVN